MATMRDDGRRRVRLRYLLPGLLVAGVAVVGLLSSDTAVQAATPPGGGSGAAQASSQNRAADPITYHLPPASYVAPGETLFEQNCSSCHGADASGTDRAP